MTASPTRVMALFDLYVFIMSQLTAKHRIVSQRACEVLEAREVLMVGFIFSHFELLGRIGPSK